MSTGINMVEVARVEPRGPESWACFVKKGAFWAIFIRETVFLGEIDRLQPGGPQALEGAGRGHFRDTYL